MIIGLLIWAAFLLLVSFFLFSKNEKKIVIFVILSFIFSEVIFVFYNVRTGIIMYSLCLALLIFSLLLREFSKETREIMIALTVLPIARLISSTAPLQQFSFLARTAIVYTIMFVSAYSVLHYLQISHDEVGHKKFKHYLMLIMIVLGAIFGLVEYFILRPEKIFDHLGFVPMIIGLSILISGYVEEFIFRGLLQNLFKKLFININLTLLLTTIIFSAMHIVWNSYLEVIFVFCVGWLIGLIYEKTRNLFLVSVLHGSINFFLFVIWPNIF